MASGPLAGIRVLDLTRVWAGPLAGMILADLGAEVIKVEGPNTRTPRHVPKGPHGSWPDGDPGEAPWNRSGTINNLTRNRRSICVDLKHPDGKDIFRRLVAVSDAVLENFAARVMDGLGLGWSDLARIRPELVYVAMPGFGGTGPYRDYVAYGPALEPAAGLPALTGYGTEPHGSGTALPDPVAGTHGAAALLAALDQRHRTGRGVHVDLSQHETAISVLGEYVVERQLTGEEPRRHQNSHARHIVQGTYPCKGEDRWIVISIRDEREWSSFDEVAGHRFARDFPDPAAAQHRDALDSAIRGWTSGRDARLLMHELQGAGVAAAVVNRGDDLVRDPHLAARKFFVELDDFDGGPRLYAGSPTRVEGDRHDGYTPAPSLGGDNEWVLGTLLSMSPTQIDALEATGVVATQPTR